MARNSTFICVEQSEVCNDDGCRVEGILSGMSLLLWLQHLVPSSTGLTIVYEHHRWIAATPQRPCKTQGCRIHTPAGLWRVTRMLLRSEILSAMLGTSFAVAAVSVCWLLAARQRSERDHSTALAAAQVPNDV